MKFPECPLLFSWLFDWISFWQSVSWLRYKHMGQIWAACAQESHWPLQFTRRSQADYLNHNWTRCRSWGYHCRCLILKKCFVMHSCFICNLTSWLGMCWCYKFWSLIMVGWWTRLSFVLWLNTMRNVLLKLF